MDKSHCFHFSRMWKKNPAHFLLNSKYFWLLGNRAAAEALVQIQDDFPLPLVPACLPMPPSLQTRGSLPQLMEVSSNVLLLLSPFDLFCRTRVFQDRSLSLSTMKEILVLCIPLYERFSLQSGESGKNVCVDVSIVVRTTSCRLFLITAGLCNRKWQLPVQ